MDSEIKAYIEKYPTKVIEFFKELRELIYECVIDDIEEKMWAKLPTYYVGESFIRLIPFKDHINIESELLINFKEELSNYKITSKGMLQIYVTQQIPCEVLKKVFLNLNKEFIIDDGMVMEYIGNGGNVTIPNGVTDIFFEAFYGSALITSIIIPGTILDITPFVFERSQILKEVKMCEGVEAIGVCAFNACEDLETIYLPKSIKIIKTGAFSNCPSLKKIYYNGSESDWNLIMKEDGWNENTSSYTLISK